MNKSGFTLIETLIAATLVAILVAITATVAMSTLAAHRRMEKSDTALNLARKKLEETIYQRFEDIDDEVYDVIPGFDNYKQMVDVEPIGVEGSPDAELKRVTVTVAWFKDGTTPTDIREALTTTVAR